MRNTLVFRPLIYQEIFCGVINFYETLIGLQFELSQYWRVSLMLKLKVGAALFYVISINQSINQNYLEWPK